MQKLLSPQNMYVHIVLIHTLLQTVYQFLHLVAHCHWALIGVTQSEHNQE